MNEGGSHGDEVQNDDEGRVYADMHELKCKPAAAQQQHTAGRSDQDHAEAGCQHMILVDPAIDWFVPAQRVQQNKHNEVEYTAAQGIADCNVRRIGDGNRTDTREQFRH